MVASKENFFKAHWDWLVAIVGLAALGVAGFYLFSSLGRSPDDAAAECSAWMAGHGWTLRFARPTRASRR